MAIVTVRPDGSRPQLVVALLAALPIAGGLFFAFGILAGTRPSHVPLLAMAIVTGLITMVPLILDQGRPAEKRHILLSMVSMSWAVPQPVPGT